MLKQISDLIDHILIVDSGSIDKTVEIATRYNCEIITKKWINYATQFNYGIEYVKTKYDWILRIDADEYFDDLNVFVQLVNRIKNGHYKNINGII